MDTRPTKRQRRFTVHSSDSDNNDNDADFDAQVDIDDSDSGDQSSSNGKRSKHEALELSGGHLHLHSRSNTKRLPVLSSRPKSSTSAASSRPTPSPEKRKQTKAVDGGSLHGFFQPASEEQRWSSRKFDPARVGADNGGEKAGDEDDLIEDDDSFDELFTRHFIEGQGQGQGQEQGQVGAIEGKSQARASAPAPAPPVKSKPARKQTSTKRFLLPGSSAGTNQSRTSPAASGENDKRPWAQKYGPLDLGELAVHKKKVSDVQDWLHDVFTGRSARRLLVLRGPAGSGKTTTVSLLSKVLGFDVVEWRNPSVTEFSAQDYVSVGSQFDEFLGRGDNFGGLELDDAPGNRDASLPSQRRILLVEEFPTILSRNSSGLAAFRLSLQRYLAAATPGLNSAGGIVNPPVIIVISETLLSSASSILDNFTAHRLLGPDIYNHPNTTIIDYNSIAPTIMQKALNLVLEKEARYSQNVRIPGPAFLENISKIGDIRSAISSLEFLCRKYEDSGAWGGTLNKKGKRSSRNNTSLTEMEKESLKMVTQREASLGIFHAVGKVVYNKREDASLTTEGTKLPSPPDHLKHHDRRKVSQVCVNELIDETGTDIQTFISALHENYPPSCEGSSFTDHLNDCIDALSDSDMLCMDQRGAQRYGGKAGFGNFNAGVDMLRQEEISFQVAARGLLFALPHPVRRKLGPGRGADAYKMNFPTSLRLWTASEEIEGLTDLWMKRLMSPFSTSNMNLGGIQPGGSNKIWHNANESDSSDGQAKTITMMSRTDALLSQLPYMARMPRNEVEMKELNKVAGFGFTGSQNTVQRRPNLSNNSSTGGLPLPSSGDQEEEKLVLSDDDIVDD